MQSDAARAYDFGQDRLPGVVSTVVELRARHGIESGEFWGLLDALPVAIMIGCDPLCSRIGVNAAARGLLRTSAGQNVSQSAPPDEAPSFAVYTGGVRLDPTELPLQKAAATGRAVTASECEIRYPDGVVVFVAGHTVPLFDAEGKPCGSVGAFVDITPAKRSEARSAMLAEELEHANRRQAVLLAVSDLMLRQDCDKAELADRVFELVAPHVGADFSFNYRMLGPDRMELVAAPGVDEASKAAARTLLPGRSFCGAVAASGRPLYADAERIGADPLGGFVRGVGGTAYACHPLISRAGEPLGTLSFGSRRRDAFDPDDHDFLRTVCQYVAVFWERETSLRALRRSDERFRLVTEGAQVGYWEWDVEHDRIVFTEDWMRLLDVGPDETFDIQRLWSLVHPDDLARLQAETEEIARDAARPSFDLQYRIVPANGSVLWVHTRGSVLREGACVRGMAGVAIDVTDRKRIEEHNDLLMREVSHRSKNLLSVVQSVAYQTFRHAGPDGFLNRFTQRISNLAANQDLVLRNAWRGVGLDDLVESQAGPFAAPSRLKRSGRAVEITPAASQTLGMALHELATNACKYGAWSNDVGIVEVAWRVEEGRLTLSWTERGGPNVVAPTRRGFGSTVLTTMVKAGLGADVSFDFGADGLAWSIACPLEAVLASGPR